MILTTLSEVGEGWMGLIITFFVFSRKIEEYTYFLMFFLILLNVV